MGASTAVPKQFDLCTEKSVHPFSSPYTHIMELEAILQISFGISATLIAVFAVWFAWRSTRCM